MKTAIFNFNRFGLLFRRYFAERIHTELIYWGIMIIAFVFLHNFILGIGCLLFVAGVFYAARFLREIHFPSQGIAYFMIPATQAEKLSVAVILTTFYYFAMMTAAYVIGNLLGTWLNNTLASVPLIASGYMELNELFYYTPLKWVLFDPNILSYTFTGVAEGNTYSYFNLFVQILIVLQSIYLLGGIYFKNNQAFKTFFVTNVILVLFVILFILEMRLITGPENEEAAMTPDDFFHIRDIFYCVLRYASWLLPPFFWIVSYFRLTEKEI
ncbi:MAG: hypothetical protein LBB85_02635 [Dysgonamonadaceae bacterium]|nr:hypothetical protein [Dysgonamonadaceae bacterium]